MAPELCSVEQVRAALETLRANGVSWSAISTKLHVSRTTLYRWARGVSRPRNGEVSVYLHVWAETVRECDKVLVGEVENRRMRTALKCESALQDRLLALRAQGMRTGELCATLGIHRKTLYNWETHGVWSRRGVEAIIRVCRERGITFGEHTKEDA